MNQTDEFDQMTYGSIRQWTRGSFLRKGVMGEVYIGKNVENGQLLLIKSAPSEPLWSKQLAALQNEEKILKKLYTSNCPNIVRILGSATSESVEEFGGRPAMDLFLQFVLPRSTMDEIVQSFGTLDDTAAKFYTLQILQCLSCMHKNGIIHSAMHGQNVLVCQNGVKICGFGGAREVTTNLCSWLLDSMLCSPRLSPALKTHHQNHQQPDEKYDFTALPCDIYEDIPSVGYLVCQMVTGQWPKIDHTSDSDVEKLMYALQLELKGKPDCLNFIKCCFDKGTMKFRWNADRLLEHPWIQSLHGESTAGDDSSEDEAATPRSPALLLHQASLTRGMSSHPQDARPSRVVQIYPAVVWIPRVLSLPPHRALGRSVASTGA